MIKPRTLVPDLDLPTVEGGRFTLSRRKPESFTLIVFYRGHHCPICRTYLGDLEGRFDEFVRRGVEVVAVSNDDREHANKSKQEWRLNKLSIAYGLSIEKAREWGLFISAAIKESEPPLFAEPGLFLIRPDGTLYCASIQTMPFARPHFGDVLNAIDFVKQKDYPARGEA